MLSNWFYYAPPSIILNSRFMFPTGFSFYRSFLILNSFFFLGKKSYIKSPTKLTSSVAYPFTLIKPCGVHGDVTLKDINQRIHAPLKSLSKLKKAEEPSLSYPTSAFSGKPVVVKTKIHTEGGKGSITILRTKGWLDKCFFILVDLVSHAFKLVLVLHDKLWLASLVLVHWILSLLVSVFHFWFYINLECWVTCSY